MFHLRSDTYPKESNPITSAKIIKQTAHAASLYGCELWSLSQNEWMKGYLRPFPRIVRLYRDSNLRTDKMKDDSPFRGLRFRGHGGAHLSQTEIDMLERAQNYIVKSVQGFGPTNSHIHSKWIVRLDLPIKFYWGKEIIIFGKAL